MQLPSLPTGRVLVFVLDPNEIPQADALGDLSAFSAAEHRRHKAFVFAKDRRIFALARSALRRLVGHYESLDPRAVSFVYGGFGKPQVDSERGLQFNVSHCSSCICIALARDMRLGVDVESAAIELPDYAEVAQRFFSPEEVRQLQQEDQPQRFFHFIELWTLKESYMKATGLGINKPPQECQFSWDAGRNCSFHDLQAGAETTHDWSFLLYQLPGEHRLALAAEARLAPADVESFRIGPHGILEPMAPRLLRRSLSAG